MKRKLTKQQWLFRKRMIHLIRISIFTVVSLACLITILYFVNSFMKPKQSNLDKYEESEFNLDGIKLANGETIDAQLLPVNEYSRPGTKLEMIQGIVIHYVGNPSTTAQNNHDYFAGLAESGATYASSHFVIGLEGEIIQNIPVNEVAYCSNNRNGDTLSIEVCHPDEKGKFTKASYKSVVALTAYLCNMFDLQVDDVIRHYDVTGKKCPLYYVDHEDAWIKLKADVENALKKLK